MVLHPIYRVEELRAIEAAASDSPLMERAGRAAAGVARDLLTDRLPRVLVLSGPGNNGGDAMVVARWLRAWFYDVTVAFCGDASRLPSDAQGAYRSWTDAGGAVADALPERVDWGLVVDGVWSMFGSANFDNRSLELNDELNVAVSDRDLARRFINDFEQDIRDSSRLELATWRQRPRLEKAREMFWSYFGEIF